MAITIHYLQSRLFLDQESHIQAWFLICVKFPKDNISGKGSFFQHLEVFEGSSEVVIYIYLWLANRWQLKYLTKLIFSAFSIVCYYVYVIFLLHKFKQASKLSVFLNVNKANAWKIH